MTISKELKILCICFSILLVFFLLPLPVLADYEGIYLLSNIPSGSIARYGTEVLDQNYIYFGTFNGEDYYGNVYRNSDISNSNRSAYFFMTHNDNDASNKFRICFAVEGQITDQDETIIISLGTARNGGGDYTIKNTSTYDAVNNLTYIYNSTYIYGLPYCEVVSGSSDSVARNTGLANLRTAINNGTAGGSPDYGPARLYIKPGTAAYISVSGGHIELYVDIGRYFRGEYYSNQRWTTASSLPSNSSSLSFNPTWGERIVYTAAGDRNILGQSKAGVADLPGGTDPLSAGYVVIYNPVYDQGGDLNPTIRVDVDDFIAVAQYPLTSSVDNGIVVATGNVDEVYSATSDDVNEGGTFDYIYSYTDSNGNTVTSSAITTPTGGNTVITENDDNTISSILESILDIFRAPITHIQNLFNAGANFFAWIANLWTWLPAPVIGVLTSALVVLIAIGVIKFLWK